MINPSKYIASFKAIPTKWIFEHYLELGESLIGQSLRFSSPLADGNNRPAMRVFYCEDLKDYRFKCHFSGHRGDGLELMRLLWGLSHGEAAVRIETDYRVWMQNQANNVNQSIELTSQPTTAIRWRVTSSACRHWTTDDAKYWSSYNIDSGLLQRYQVAPLLSYTMTRIKPALLDGQHEQQLIESFDVSEPGIYGYFYQGKLAKIYQPGKAARKFILVDDAYVQGFEQLQGSNVLVLCSSMKDMLALQSLNLGVDALAPNSENTPFPDWVIEQVFPLYAYKLVIFDNDDTGLRTMQDYYDRYDIPFLLDNRAKDLADGVKTIGAEAYADPLLQRMNQVLLLHAQQKQTVNFA